MEARQRRIVVALLFAVALVVGYFIYSFDTTDVRRHEEPISNENERYVRRRPSNRDVDDFLRPSDIRIVTRLTTAFKVANGTLDECITRMDAVIARFKATVRTRKLHHAFVCNAQGPFILYYCDVSSSDYSVIVPAASAKDFVNALRTTLQFPGSNAEVMMLDEVDLPPRQDEDVDVRLAIVQDKRARLLKLLDAAVTMADKLSVNEQLNDVEQEWRQREKAVNATRRRENYAIVSWQLDEPRVKNLLVFPRHNTHPVLIGHTIFVVFVACVVIWVCVKWYRGGFNQPTVGTPVQCSN